MTAARVAHFCLFLAAFSAANFYAKVYAAGETAQIVLVQSGQTNELPIPSPTPLDIPAMQATDRQLVDAIGGATALTLIAPPLAPIAAGVVFIDAMVNLGTVLWDVVQLGKPSASFETSIANALPRGITTWTQLENWKKTPVVQEYCVPLLPGHDFDCDLGAQSADSHFKFRVSFVAGGDLEGRGQYIAGVTVQPVDVALVYREVFNAQTQIVSVSNLGTDDDPVAGMKIKISWQSNRFEGQMFGQSMNVMISGDGTIEQDASITIDQPLKTPPKFWYR